MTDIEFPVVRAELSNELLRAMLGKTATVSISEILAIIARLRASDAAEIARLKAIMLDEDLIWDALLDSMDVDWSGQIGARAVVAAFQKEIDGE